MGSQYIINGPYKLEFMFLYFSSDATGFLYSSQGLIQECLLEEGGGGHIMDLL